jgi:hypothetical protein
MILSFYPIKTIFSVFTKHKAVVESVGLSRKGGAISNSGRAEESSNGSQEKVQSGRTGSLAGGGGVEFTVQSRSII